MKWECDRCDGCGWYEGGKALKTKCEKCGGTGVLDKPDAYLHHGISKTPVYIEEEPSIEQARQEERQKCIPSEEEIEVFLIENKICGMRMENIVKVIHNWLEGRRP